MENNVDKPLFALFSGLKYFNHSFKLFLTMHLIGCWYYWQVSQKHLSRSNKNKDNLKEYAICLKYVRPVIK